MTNEITMVELLQGFIKKHDGVKSVIINPDTGNEVVCWEQVPRGLKPVSDKVWEDSEYITKMLGLCVGSKVRETRKGTQIRDIFMSKVQGGPKPGGGNWAWLKVGQLFSKAKQDAETGEIKETYWVQIGVKKWERPTDTTGTEAEEPQKAPSDEDKAKTAIDAVTNL